MVTASGGLERLMRNTTITVLVRLAAALGTPPDRLLVREHGGSFLIGLETIAGLRLRLVLLSDLPYCPWPRLQFRANSHGAPF